MKLFGDQEWSPRIQHMGCWLHTSSTFINAADDDVNHKVTADETSSDYTNVLQKCALKARRQNWWGFVVNNCKSDGKNTCTCAQATKNRDQAEPHYYKDGVSEMCDMQGTTFIGGNRTSSPVDVPVSVYQVKGSGLAQLTSDWFNTDISYQAPSLTRIDGANFSPTVGGTEVVISFESGAGYGVEIDGLR